jgi:hypothetical protein
VVIARAADTVVIRGPTCGDDIVPFEHPERRMIALPWCRSGPRKKVRRDARTASTKTRPGSPRHESTSHRDPQLETTGQDAPCLLKRGSADFTSSYTRLTSRHTDPLRPAVRRRGN